MTLIGVLRALQEERGGDNEFTCGRSLHGQASQAARAGTAGLQATSKRSSVLKSNVAE